ncbi:probable UDP-glucose 6-dehydrogenase [Fusarium fujikuroi IMI 58289]|uniref:UDP-glucose 6-dehydrogenase n=1 Tax=Gibberella fujikuroi (strain CBS 195.34 / IMI 58289 / NRRL A-6831) TaxID=1279085 RepID=S0EMB1_GIBF5|nr:probable UDP-glucose 6-dehydrogenase [Fusarium fujikuroi IMI 58289]CCT73513.1 probable UDP-glucose 6-dehydrogenase [Fusarium fujikuroi IMI 58289]SCO10658.1 probable UDP-glucose 6-dehydrogenase [Fusarium fujikuroi]
MSSNGTQEAPIEVRRICCVGAGYVGGPTAAVVAFQNPHIQVTVVDRDTTRIRRWNSRHPPIYEPGLHDIVRIARDGGRPTKISNEPTTDSEGSSAEEGEITVAERKPNLFFSADIAKHIGEADIVLVAVNTPTKYRGVGAGSATDMTAFEAVTGVVAQYAREGAIIVEKSTVPCRTAQLVADTLNMHRPGVHFEILSNPEFLAAGTAVNDLLYPDRILIGSAPTPSGKRAAEALVKVYNAWIPRERILTTNVWSSELAKLVANSMLAQRISSINSISAVCEQTGADVDEVARAVGVDPRIGNKFLMAGIGFGGSCFKKDVLNLVYLAETMGLPEVAEYWRQVVKMNEYARDRFSNRVIKCLNNTLVGKKVTILGFAFKKNTSDTREAPALEMIKTLLEERPREVAVFDPCCNPLVIKAEIKELLGPLAEGHNITVHGNAYDACESSTAIIIATEFDEFRNQPPPPPAPTPAVQSKTIGRKPNPKADPRPFESATPSANELLALHKHLVQRADVQSHDPLDRFNVEPSCEDDCPDCIQERESKDTGFATGMGSSEEYKPKERVDWVRISESMAKPRWVFDGRGVIDSREMVKLGVRVESVGRQHRF